MNMHAYKFGYSGPGSTSYYCPYGMNDTTPRMDVGRRAWEYPSMMNMEDATAIEMEPDENMATSVPTEPEERQLDLSVSSFLLFYSRASLDMPIAIPHLITIISTMF